MDEILYGKHAVLEALKSGRPIQRVSFQKGMNTRGVSELITRLEASKIPYRFVEKKRLDEMAENHQGVIAQVSAVEYQDWKDFCQGGLVLLLDGITDGHNLGAILRSAHSFGAEGVIIPRRRSAAVDSVVYKASAGAAAHIPVARVSNLGFVLDDLKRMGYWIYGAQAHGETKLWDLEFPKATALVIGSEDKGISPVLQKKCDGEFIIPTQQFESLNASVAAGIACYQYAKSQVKKP